MKAIAVLSGKPNSAHLVELAKRTEVHLTQPRPFADVEIRRELAGEAA